LNPQSAIRNPQWSRAWLPLLTGRPGWVVVSALALTAALGMVALRIRYDHNLLHLQPRNLDSVKWELTLIEHTAGASWHALSYTDTPEEALALKARYEQLPGVSRVVEVASLVPGDQDRKLELLADLRRRLDHLPPRGALIEHARPNSQNVVDQLTHLIERLRPLAEGASQQLLTHFRDSLIGLREHLLACRMAVFSGEGPINQEEQWAVASGERLRHFDQRLAGDLAEDLHRLREVCMPEPITVEDLPPALRERYVGRTGKWLLRVFARDCLWDFEPLERFTQEVRSVEREATGKPFSTVEGLKAMKNSFQWAGVYAFVAIVAVLLIDFRRPRTALLALAPLAMGVIFSLGIFGLFGLPLNPANMIAFPLILGVGVDNGVHVIHDYLIRRVEGRTTISYAIGRGVLVKALTTMIGFGALMISSQRGLVSLGFILTLGVGCCMVTALVFLPAALRLWSGRVRTAELREPAAAPLRRAA
jgi:hypothetical protein